MCGLVAYYSTSKPLAKSRLINALDKIHHRGPDGQGLWTTPDNQVALGHVRLSIIDLEGGSQPLHSQDKRVHAVVNGEFYEFESIRQDLETKGYQFNTFSDSEILIALYQEYGTECMQFLRGEFAFVLWDDNKQRLFAARDRFGIKPLFFSHHNESLYLASEAKALFELGVPCHWNMKSLHAFESFLPSQQNTLFDNIQAIKPGHFLIADKDSIQTYCYWDFNYPTANGDFYDASEKELTLQFRQLLEEAVSIRLRSDVPVGCYLSGGLDSCAVLGLMSNIRHQPIDTFTLSFNEQLFDEAEIAAEMSGLAGANHHCFAIDEKMLSDNFSDALYHNESLIFNNNSVAKFMLSRFTQQAGYKVILTGEGSDEVLAGYPIFREDMLRYDTKHQDPVIINQLIKQLHENNKASQGIFSTTGATSDFAEINQILGYIPSMLKAASSGALILDSLHTEDYHEQIHCNNPLKNFFGELDWQQLQERSPLIKSLYLWSKSALPGMILVHLGDRMEMAHSLEGRVPFLDHKLVEFLTRVPNHLKINGLTEKYILRESVKDVITETVYKRQKHPFLAPPSSTKENPFNTLMRETFNSDDLKHSPFYDQKKVLKLFNNVESMTPTTRQEFDKIFMHILSVCTFEKSFRPSLLLNKAYSD